MFRLVRYIGNHKTRFPHHITSCLSKLADRSKSELINPIKKKSNAFRPDDLNCLSFQQLKACATAAGYAGRLSRETLVKLLVDHYSLPDNEIPASIQAFILANKDKHTMNHDLKGKVKHNGLLLNEIEEKYRFGASLHQLMPAERHIDVFITHRNIQFLTKYLGLKGNAKQVVLLRQLNDLFSTVVEKGQPLGSLELPVHLLVPVNRPRKKKPDLVVYSPILTQLDHLSDVTPVMLAAALDPHRRRDRCDDMTVPELKAEARRLFVSTKGGREVLLARVLDRRRREALGEAVMNPKARTKPNPRLTAEEAQAAVAEKAKSLPKIRAFRTFLRTRHLNKPLRAEQGEYTLVRALEVAGHLLSQGTIRKRDVDGLLDDALLRLRSLPNVVHVARPRRMDGSAGSVTVVGDTLGRFGNLLHLLAERVGGEPAEDNAYVFCGNMIDRGAQSMQVLITLLLMHLAAPQTVHLLRGAQETIALSSRCGFTEEVLRQYDQDTLDRFKQVMGALPVAATVGGKVFVVHGGVGRATSAMTLEQLNGAFERNSEPERGGPLSELLWADPQDGLRGFSTNGLAFGPDVTEAFLARNGLDLLVRAHECVTEGFECLHGGRVATVFSVPMCYGRDSEYVNLGAVMRFDAEGADDMTPRFIQFDSCAEKEKGFVSSGTVLSSTVDKDFDDEDEVDDAGDGENDEFIAGIV